MRKVVIDTDVMVSAVLFGGSPGELITLWKGRRVHPLCSKGIIEEYLRVLAYPKFNLSEKEIDFILSQEILPWFDIVPVPAGRPYVKADPQDDRFIWCAIEGKAEVIIFGDEHLLNLTRSPVPIMSVTTFLEMLGPEERE